MDIDFQELVALPESTEDFDLFVANICEAYGFTPSDDITATVAQHILHADAAASHLPLSFFGDRIHKMLANKTAYEVIQALKAKAEVKPETTTPASDGEAP